MKDGDRVKAIRKSTGLTLEKFGERLGVAKTTISRIENGVNGLTDQMCRSICREFGVSEEWLRDGIGGDEIVFERTANDAAAAFAKENGLENIEEVLLREYLQLEDKERETFRKYLKNVLRDLYGADQAKEDAPATESAEDQQEREIQAKLASYEAELRAAATSGKSGVSQIGNANDGKDEIVSAG